MKRVVNIINREGSGFDALLWSAKSSNERIGALEHLRTQQLTNNGIRQRLQRVCRVVEQAQR